MISLAVFAGGKSERMGEDKALKPFLGRPLVLRIMERLTSFANETFLVTDRPAAYPFIHFPIFPDLRPGYGPLGGLYTALSVAKHPFVAVVACDMPFASLAMFKHEYNILRDTGVDVVVPSSADGLEPLHAVYRREICQPAIEHFLDIGELKLISWFQDVKVRILSQEEVAKFNPQNLAFWNLNTPKEFELAQELAKRIIE